MSRGVFSSNGFATDWGYTCSIVLLLLLQGAPRAMADASSGSSLFDAAKTGDVEALKKLLAHDSALLDYCGKGTPDANIGNSAAHWAAAKGH